MDQYFSADRNDMKAVLIRVRGTRWVEARNKVAFPSFDGGRVGPYYKEFMNQVRENVGSFDALNDLNDLPLWRNMTADEILKEIRNSPTDCRRAFDRLLGRYWSAAKSYLLDIVSSEWRTHLLERFRESRELTFEEVPSWTGKIEDEAFSFCRFLAEDADVSVRILMERMLMIQQIQARLNEPVGYGDLSGGNQFHPSKKPRGAKKVAIEFIIEQVKSNPEFRGLTEMKQGRNFKAEKAALWDAFKREFPEHADIENTFRNDYVTDALKIFSEQTSD